MPESSADPLARFGGQAGTLFVAALGGIAFLAMAVPGGATSGSVIAVAAMTATGLVRDLGPVLRYTALGVLGSAIGSVIGPDTFSHLAAYPGSIAMMAVCVVLMTAASALIYVLLLGWSPATAILASVPGAMSYIIAVSTSFGADAARITVVQMSRVIFLATVLPWVITHGVEFTPTAPSPSDPIWAVLLSLAAGFAVGGVFVRFGVTGGMVVGSMIGSGALHFFNVAPGRAPPWLLETGQILLGAWVGTRFIGFNWRLLGGILFGALVALTAMMAISILFALAAARWLGAPLGAAVLGYSPGAQEVMSVLAVVMGTDPVFVTAHHLARFFLISATLPPIVQWLRRRNEAVASRGAPCDSDK